MTQSRAKRVLTLVVVVAMVTSPMTAAVGAVTATSAQSPQTYSATDNVEVWERAPLPFRLDTGDAAKSVANGAMDVELTEFNSGPVSIRQSELGVYQPGDTVSASFENVAGAGTSDFNGNDTQLVIARLEPSGDGDSTDALPDSIGDAQDLFTEENANQNATFWVKDTPQVTNGNLDTSVQFSESGTYALFLATGSAFDAPANGGDISVSGDTTIIGMDGALVEEGPADVDVGSQEIEPGDDATFTVNTGATDTNVSVLLYETDTVTNSETVFRVTEPVDSSLNASDITIRHSISEVNGIADFDGPVSVLGTTFNDGRMSGSTSAASTIDFLVDEINNQSNDQSVDQPNTEVIGSGDVLDASVIGKSGVDGSVTISVDTFGNWSTGQYTWVVTTGGESTGDIRTDVGTLDLKTDTGDGDDGDDGDTTPPDDGDEDEPKKPPVIKPPTKPIGEQPETPRVEGGGSGASVEKQDGRITVNLPEASAGDTVTVTVPTNESELERDGASVNGVNLTFNQDSSGGLDVTTTTDPGVPPVSRDGDLGYFEITHSIPNENVGGATYDFSVSKQRLEDRGLEPSEVSLYRYEDNGWRELDTRHVRETETAHRYTADSPGLSKYAISRTGAAQTDMQVTDASLSTTEVQVGDSIEVTATIENQGSAAGEFTASLQIDDTPVDSTTVELGAGEQTTVTFTTTMDEVGDYSVSVSGTEAGTVSVSSQETTEPTTTQTTTAPDETTTPGGDGGGGISPLIWLAVILLLAALGALAYLYTQGYFDEEIDRRL